MPSPPSLSASYFSSGYISVLLPLGPQAPHSVPFCGLKFRNKILSKKHWVLPEASEGTRAQHNEWQVAASAREAALARLSLESQSKILSRFFICFPTQSPTRRHRNQHKEDLESPTPLRADVDRCFQRLGKGTKEQERNVGSSEIHLCSAQS